MSSSSSSSNLWTAVICGLVVLVTLYFYYAKYTEHRERMRWYNNIGRTIETQGRTIERLNDSVFELSRALSALMASGEAPEDDAAPPSPPRKEAEHVRPIKL